MTDLPDDTTLRARGLYSTLQRERHKRLKVVRDACEAIQAQARLVLRDAEADVDHEDAPLQAMQRRVTVIEGTLSEIRDLNAQIAEVKPQAWPEDK